jgi:hypothetical protein
LLASNTTEFFVAFVLETRAIPVAVRGLDARRSMGS